MDLLAIANFVCTKTGLVTAEDKAAAKGFAKVRCELIYSAALWKNSLFAVNLSLDPATADGLEGVVFCPEDVDRVVAVRTTAQSVRVRQLEDFYRTDFDSFSQRGSPCEFALLQPIWMIWRGYVALVISAPAPDALTPFKVQWRDETGAKHTEEIGNGVTMDSTNIGPNLIPSTAVYDSGGSYSIAVTADALYAFSGDAFRNGGGTPASSPVVVQSGINIYTGTPGDPVNATLQLCSKARLEIESVFKPATTNPVVFAGEVFNNLTQPTGGTIAAAATRSPAYQRIRFFSIPTVATTVSVLAKMKSTSLDYDQEVSTLKNIDNCLIAFVHADLLEYRRQYGKAQSKMQEAVALLQQVIDVEALQEATNARIQPEEGFGRIRRPNFNSGTW